MRVLSALFAMVLLALSGGAAFLIFGGVHEQPEDRVRTQQAARVEALSGPAASGDVVAQYEIATLYRSAVDGVRDFGAAARWYREAARAGHIGAQFELGRLYEEGQGVKQSYARAAEWHLLAARLGRHPEAQFALGQLHFHGRGVPHDYGEAILWYRRAADQGHAVAQFLLGRIYEDGWGVDRDYVEAYTWYALAGRRRDEVVAVRPDYDPDASLAELRARMNRSQIAVAERRVLDRRAAAPD